MDRESLAARLLATFLDELDDQVRALDAELLALEAGDAQPERVRAVFRVMHTLKGAARAADVRPIEEMCHAIEGRLAPGRASGIVSPSEVTLLFAVSDALKDAGARLRGGDRLEGGAVNTLNEQLRGLLPLSPAAPSPQRAQAASERVAQPATPAAASTPPVESRAAEPSDAVRLTSRQVEAVAGAAGDVLAAAGAVASRPAAAGQLHDTLRDLQREWAHVARSLRATLGRAGFDGEAVEALDRFDRGVGVAARDAARLTRSLTDDARTLASSTAHFRESVRRLRMRPFGDIVEALPRAARDVAVALGKEVRLGVEGQDVEADRAVLDAVREPLLQLVRNAIDHGIERPADRVRRGKPAAGLVSVRAAVQGDRVALTVSDDGAGIDVGLLREALGGHGAPAPLTDAEVVRALLEGGVSTRVTATAISGRGVGLDIVRAVADRLGGTLDVDFEAGRGTTFTLSLPVSAATVRCLLVRVGALTIAIPVSAVAGVVRLRAPDVRVVQGQTVVTTREAPIPLAPFGRVLGAGAATLPHDDVVRAVHVELGSRRAMLAVDDVLDERETVVMPLEHVDERTASLYMGAVLLDATHVALVVNPAALVARARAGSLGAPGDARAGRERRRPRVLVVDDSITTRTLEQSVLSAAGYDVLTAVDGVDGWRVIEQGGVDLVLTDVEMPRMDGVVLCERIRASSAFASLPVVMVTSLDRPEERARGLEAGADAYVTKSSFDQDRLLDIIAQLLGGVE